MLPSVVVLVLATSSMRAAEETLLEASCRLDLGADIGQNFGSLFEVRDAQGRTVMGAGFPGVYNTHVRNERYNLQFYMRPPGEATEARPEPHSEPAATTYAVFDCTVDVIRAARATIEQWLGESE